MLFGIREHAMEQSSTELAITVFHSSGATFAVFADYMRPSVRISALTRYNLSYLVTIPLP